MSKKIELKVGDKLCRRKYSFSKERGDLSVITIGRLTSTQAVSDCGGYRFNILNHCDSIYARGENDFRAWRILSEQDVEDIRYFNFRQKIADLPVEKLSIFALEKILEIVEQDLNLNPETPQQ